MAKFTQARYGTNIKAEILSVLQLRLIKRRIDKKSATITTNASQGFCSEKKAGDHRKFKPSWVHHNVKCDPFLRASNWRHPATAISTYNIVQTGPKTQFGGLKNGLFSSAYHSPGDVRVPIAMPLNSTATTKYRRTCRVRDGRFSVVCRSTTIGQSAGCHSKVRRCVCQKSRCGQRALIQVGYGRASDFCAAYSYLSST